MRNTLPNSESDLEDYVAKALLSTEPSNLDRYKALLEEMNTVHAAGADDDDVLIRLDAVWNKLTESEREATKCL